MAQIKAPWEVFPDIWNGSAAMQPFDIMRKNTYAQGQELINQLQEEKIKQLAEEHAIQDTIKQRVAESGMTDFNKLPSMIRDIRMQAGDVSGAMDVNKDIQSGQRTDQLERLGNLSAIIQLKKAGASPEVIKHYADALGLTDELGSLDFASEVPELHGGLKEGLWTQNPDGSLNIVRQPAPDKGDKPPVYQPYVLTDGKGNFTAVDRHDPKAIAEAFSQGWKPKPDFMDELSQISNAGGDLSGGESMPEAPTAKIPKAPTTLKPKAPPPNPGESKQAYIKRMTTGVAGM